MTTLENKIYLPQSNSEDSIDSGVYSPSTETAPKNTTASSISLVRQLAAQFPEYERTPLMEPFGGVWMNPNTEIDRSDVERIIEVSNNGRFAKLNTFLGKGAFKVVYKAIDREEGYEVAWNVLQVIIFSYLFIVYTHTSLGNKTRSKGSRA